MAGSLLETREDLKALLMEAQTIAVVGISEKPDRDSHSISRYLMDHGHRIVGVNPTAGVILGEPCYPSLSAIPDDVRRTIGLVAIFRKPEDAEAVIAEAARLGLKKIWLPPGAASPEALAAANAEGMKVVADKCLRVVHSQVMR